MRKLSRIGILITCLTLLASCGGESISVAVTFRAPEERIAPLIESIERVMIRKLAARGIQSPSVNVSPTEENTARLTVGLKKGVTASMVEEIVKQPFSIDLRIQEKAASTIDGSPGEWTTTDIDGSKIEWVQPIRHPETSALGVEVVFTEEGRKSLEQVFTTHQGKSLGIFVRDLLMSSVTMKGSIESNSIVIEGVPSEYAATVFSDDVNVGLRATFSLIK